MSTSSSATKPAKHAIVASCLKPHLNGRKVGVKLNIFFAFFSLTLEKNVWVRNVCPNGIVKYLKNSWLWAVKST